MISVGSDLSTANGGGMDGLANIVGNVVGKAVDSNIVGNVVGKAVDGKADTDEDTDEDIEEKMSTNDKDITADMCDVVIEGNVCYGDGSYMYAPSASMADSVLSYSFDNNIYIDNSGSGNHINSEIHSAPSFNGSNSARFDQTYVRGMIKNHHSASITISFWLFIYSHETTSDRNCPVIWYGEEGEHGIKLPEISINSSDHRIRVAYSCRSGDLFALSNARLPISRWHSIVMVKDQNTIYLYINGILDNAFQLSDPIEADNDIYIYLGGTEDTTSTCNVPILIEDLDISGAAWSQDDVQAISSINPLGFAGSVQFVCLHCSLEETSKGCSHGYTACRAKDIHRIYGICDANGYNCELASESGNGIGFCCS